MAQTGRFALVDARDGGNVNGFATLWLAISIQRHFHPYLECETAVEQCFWDGLEHTTSERSVSFCGFHPQNGCFWLVVAELLAPEARAEYFATLAERVTI